MNIFFAIGLYLLLMFSVLQGWMPLVFVSIILFSFYSNTAWLILLAILLDGYMGSFYSVPALSWAAVIWFGVIEYLRSRFVNFSAS